MTERDKFEKRLNTLDKQTLVAMAAKQARIIEELQAATKAAVPQWIPVSERLPKVGESILVYDETGFYGRIYTIKTCEQSILRMRGDVPHYTKATHWMPLPAAPEVK